MSQPSTMHNSHPHRTPPSTTSPALLKDSSTISVKGMSSRKATAAVRRRSGAAVQWCGCAVVWLCDGAEELWHSGGRYGDGDMAD